MALHAEPDAVFQYSTTRALLAGLYDGALRIEQAAEWGDLAIGTVNAIDGELIAVEGRYFRIGADGIARRLPPEARTPFIVVKDFQSEHQASLPPGLDLEALKAHLDTLIGSENLFHAVVVRGRFGGMVTRSEPKQSPPYKPLAEVMAEQQVRFELGEVEGTLVGFRCPAYVEGLNVAGYHFHFLSADERRGGHVLALETRKGRIEIDTAHALQLELPEDDAFAQLDLHSGRGAELDAVERGR